MGIGMKGSYLGFTFNGQHSSDFGITRTSDGSRFNQGLLPTVQDKAAQIPGRPGSVLQSSNYGTKVFSVSFAYDNITESQLQEMSAWLGDKKIHELVFDETPYKHWYAKVTGNATVKWIPFEEGSVNRTYKGEGTVQFTCYEPFAHCKYNWWSDDTTLSGQEEWLGASRLELTRGYNFLSDSEQPSQIGGMLKLSEKGLLFSDGGFQKNERNILSLPGLKIIEADLLAGSSFIIEKGAMYNCGDLDTDFKLIIKSGDTKTFPSGSISIQPKNSEDITAILSWNTITLLDEEDSIMINTKMNLIEGIRDNKKTGNIYDQYLTSNNYFKLPIGQSQLDININESYEASIDFDYLYF